ncbi:MAG TPA: hypothetical protein VFX23_10180, partial [Limnobacter sp.]|uniref:hypothetical protein n=1 Tax=Limnobacter sp. TaxID=2003368 RepID=UPI002E35A4EA
DLLIAKTGLTKEPYRFGRIERIQIDKMDHQSIILTEDTKFAIQVPFRAKENHEYWLVCDVVNY